MNSSSTRRDFLHQAAGLATSIAVVPETLSSTAAAETYKQLLPTIKLGQHDVSRLIVGGNPVNGHAHFNRLLSQHQLAWHTPEHIHALLKRCEEVGINTWQNSYEERSLKAVERFQQAGVKLHWLCLTKPDALERVQQIDDSAKRGAIGIAPHGALAERLHRQNKLDDLAGLLKRIRDKGVLVGLSAHNPALIELSEEKGWNVDYYMCCLYYLTRPRSEYEAILGKDLPLGEIYLPSDPPRMFKTIQAARKPCLVYKVLAAGRRIGNPAEVRRCFQTAFEHIKPTDALIVGMYQQFSDQVLENANLVRELVGK